MRSDLFIVDSQDNVAVALTALVPGEQASLSSGLPLAITDPIPAKHKVALRRLRPGDAVRLFGMIVGQAEDFIEAGGLITTANTRHFSEHYSSQRQPVSFPSVDSTRWRTRTFDGFPRPDGQVGTRNLWLVLPLVFCENRNIDRMRLALEEELGYGSANNDRLRVRQLLQRSAAQLVRPQQAFPHVDGIRFLSHEGGCGGTRQDAESLCRLLAGYIAHPNVAGATVLSLGCQNAQVSLLRSELERLGPAARKPVHIFDQQQLGSERRLLDLALAATIDSLRDADQLRRQPASLSHLHLALKCGGSDGLSGLTANPLVGRVSDLVISLGGRSTLGEFPELHGVEQQLINRCLSSELANRFCHLIETYQLRLKAAGSGFEWNPSPGNLADGLTTDAMKSAGAAQKAGTAPISEVLDYPERSTRPGLSLLCTPGNDVESVTAMVGAGANLVLFTTGLGTPTGSAVAPVLKIATNSALAQHMADIIDFDAGPLLDGLDPTQATSSLLDQIIATASGQLTASERHGQFDFIPWKRGLSL